jgi:hypothetical protein
MNYTRHKKEERHKQAYIYNMVTLPHSLTNSAFVMKIKHFEALVNEEM